MLHSSPREPAPASGTTPPTLQRARQVGSQRTQAPADSENRRDTAGGGTSVEVPKSSAAPRKAPVVVPPGGVQAPAAAPLKLQKPMLTPSQTQSRSSGGLSFAAVAGGSRGAIQATLTTPSASAFASSGGVAGSVPPVLPLAAPATGVVSLSSGTVAASAAPNSLTSPAQLWAGQGGQQPAIFPASPSGAASSNQGDLRTPLPTAAATAATAGASVLSQPPAIAPWSPHALTAGVASTPPDTDQQQQQQPHQQQQHVTQSFPPNVLPVISSRSPPDATPITTTHSGFPGIGFDASSAYNYPQQQSSFPQGYPQTGLQQQDQLRMPLPLQEHLPVPPLHPVQQALQQLHHVHEQRALQSYQQSQQTLYQQPYQQTPQQPYQQVQPYLQPPSGFLPPNQLPLVQQPQFLGDVSQQLHFLSASAQQLQYLHLQQQQQVLLQCLVQQQQLYHGAWPAGSQAAYMSAPAPGVAFPYVDNTNAAAAAAAFGMSMQQQQQQQQYSGDADAGDGVDSRFSADAGEDQVAEEEGVHNDSGEDGGEDGTHEHAEALPAETAAEGTSVSDDDVVAASEKNNDCSSSVLHAGESNPTAMTVAAALTASLHRPALVSAPPQSDVAVRGAPAAANDTATAAAAAGVPAPTAAATATTVASVKPIVVKPTAATVVVARQTAAPKRTASTPVVLDERNASLRASMPAVTTRGGVPVVNKATAAAAAAAVGKGMGTAESSTPVSSSSAVATVMMPAADAPKAVVAAPRRAWGPAVPPAAAAAAQGWSHARGGASSPFVPSFSPSKSDLQAAIMAHDEATARAMSEGNPLPDGSHLELLMSQSRARLGLAEEEEEERQQRQQQLLPDEEVEAVAAAIEASMRDIGGGAGGMGSDGWEVGASVIPAPSASAASSDGNDAGDDSEGEWKVSGGSGSHRSKGKGKRVKGAQGGLTTDAAPSAFAAEAAILEGPGSRDASAVAVGLDNRYGENNCYLNVVVQALFRVRPFWPRFRAACVSTYTGLLGIARASPADSQERAAVMVLLALHRLLEGMEGAAASAAATTGHVPTTGASGTGAQGGSLSPPSSAPSVSLNPFRLALHRALVARELAAAAAAAATQSGSSSSSSSGSSKAQLVAGLASRAMGDASESLEEILTLIHESEAIGAALAATGRARAALLPPERPQAPTPQPPSVAGAATAASPGPETTSKPAAPKPVDPKAAAETKAALKERAEHAASVYCTALELPAGLKQPTSVSLSTFGTLLTDCPVCPVCSKREGRLDFTAMALHVNTNELVHRFKKAGGTVPASAPTQAPAVPVEIAAAAAAAGARVGATGLGASGSAGGTATPAPAHPHFDSLLREVILESEARKCPACTARIAAASTSAARRAAASAPASAPHDSAAGVTTTATTTEEVTVKAGAEAPPTMKCERTLARQPSVFTVVLGWMSNREPQEHLAPVLEAIDGELDLGEMFHAMNDSDGAAPAGAVGGRATSAASAAASLPARLRGLVCYVDNHWVGFFDASARGSSVPSSWLCCNDERVFPVAHPLTACAAHRLQPSLLFYECGQVGDRIQKDRGRSQLHGPPGGSGLLSLPGMSSTRLSVPGGGTAQETLADISSEAAFPSLVGAAGRAGGAPQPVLKRRAPPAPAVESSGRGTSTSGDNHLLQQQQPQQQASGSAASTPATSLPSSSSPAKPPSGPSPATQSPQSSVVAASSTRVPAATPPTVGRGGGSAARGGGGSEEKPPASRAAAAVSAAGGAVGGGDGGGESSRGGKAATPGRSPQSRKLGRQ